MPVSQIACVNSDSVRTLSIVSLTFSILVVVCAATLLMHASQPASQQNKTWSVILGFLIFIGIVVILAVNVTIDLKDVKTGSPNTTQKYICKLNKPHEIKQMTTALYSLAAIGLIGSFYTFGYSMNPYKLTYARQVNFSILGYLIAYGIVSSILSGMVFSFVTKNN